MKYLPSKNKKNNIFFIAFLFSISFFSNVMSAQAVTKNAYGFAWSENIGWLSFNWPDIGDAGPSCLSGTCQPSLIGDDFLGWARACSVFQTGCSGALKPDSERGGWEGWISLNSENCDVNDDGILDIGTCGGNGVMTVTPYKVSRTAIDPTQDDLSEWAWGGDVVGWVSFNSINCNTDGDGTYEGGAESVLPVPIDCPTTGTVYPYKVKFQQDKPEAKDLSAGINNYCTQIFPNAFTFQWQYHDPQNTSSTKYDFEINRNDGKTCTFSKNVVVLNDEYMTISGDDLNIECNSVVANFLEYNERSYAWHVKVYDSNNDISIPPAVDPSFTTPKHQYPIACFSYNPSNIKQNIEETFDPFDSSDPPNANEVRSLPGSSVSASFDPDGLINVMEWNFGTGNVPPVNNPDPSTYEQKFTYTIFGSFNVNLKVTDADGYVCEKSLTVGVAAKPKKIIETKPQ